MWGYERVLHLALVGEARGLAEPAQIVEPLDPGDDRQRVRAPIAGAPTA